MINIKKLNAPTLTVKNLKESQAWYNKHFGFKYLYDIEGGILIEKDGIELCLQEHENPNAPIADPEQQICIHCLGFEVSKDDFEKIIQEFQLDDDDYERIEHKKFKSVIISDPNDYLLSATTSWTT